MFLGIPNHSILHLICKPKVLAHHRLKILVFVRLTGVEVFNGVVVKMPVGEDASGRRLNPCCELLGVFDDYARIIIAEFLEYLWFKIGRHAEDIVIYPDLNGFVDIANDRNFFSFHRCNARVSSRKRSFLVQFIVSSMV